VAGEGNRVVHDNRQSDAGVDSSRRQNSPGDEPVGQDVLRGGRERVRLAYPRYGQRGHRRITRHAGVILVGVGLSLCGAALLIWVLRSPGQPAPIIVAAAPAPTPADAAELSARQLAALMHSMVEDPQVADRFREHLADWVEDRQFRLMQQELAEFVRSDRMHELLRASFREFRAPDESPPLTHGPSARTPTAGHAGD